MPRISRPWLVVALCMVAFIWGNSLVPGEGSSGISMAVVDAVRGFLNGLGLPYAWVSNFLVRKTAHFCEYAVLGLIMVRALDPSYTRHHLSLALIAAVLVLVPSVDETIQLFTSGRSAQITDVMLDCCGAACGVLMSYTLVRALFTKSENR